jgi:large-conductance mechanosensitive channel
MEIFSEIRDYFVSKDNLGLATGVVFGNVFSLTIGSFVKDLILPTLRSNELNIDTFVDAVLLFFITILVLFFLIIKPLKHILELNIQIEKEKERTLLASVIVEENLKLENKISFELNSLGEKLGVKIGNSIDKELNNSVVPYS